MILDKLQLIPSYEDAESTISNENKAFIWTPGFGDVRRNFCRYPAPNYYTISHVLHEKRQTEIRSAVCSAARPELCPDQVYPNEIYYYRTLNEPCRTAKSQAICQKSHQKLCDLRKQEDKLYCTSYTNVLSSVFGIKRDEFEDQPQKSYPTAFCADSYSTCQVCRRNCSGCAAKRGRQGCSCCYRKCLTRCQDYYAEDCMEIPRKCAKGDTSEFKLTANKPSNLKLKFNCYLELKIPKRLYRVRYRVRHVSGRYQSEWVTKSLEILGRGEGARKRTRKSKNSLDALEITHSVNSDLSTFLYLRGERRNENEPYGYRVAGMGSAGKLGTGGPVNIQPVRPFSISTGTWGYDGNCRKLSNWESLFQKDFKELEKANVQNKGTDSLGAFSYNIYNSTHPPTLTLSISEAESLLRHVVINGTVRNDASFDSSLSRSNSTWEVDISGYFTSCPGFLGLRVIDEIDHVKVFERDILVLCPKKRFRFEIQIPRKGLEDKERLFSVFLLDSQKELKLQLAMVDRDARKTKQSTVLKTGDSRQSPWLILMPLFVTTGIILIALLTLMVYAQVTAPEREQRKVHLKPGWHMVKVEEPTEIRGEERRADIQKCTAAPREGINSKNVKYEVRNHQSNKIKRRHLLLVVFVVVVRVVYSLVFTFSMALAALILIHSQNLKTLQDYKDFVSSKVDQSNQIARTMDNFREREIKRLSDHSEDIQRSCDYFMSLQFNWLSQNMSCVLQENQVKIFNKLSKKISQGVAEKLQELRQKVKERVEKFQADTRLKITDQVDGIRNYGERVYRNGWFVLPRGAYNSFGRRKKREIVHHLNNSKKFDLPSSERQFPNLFRQKRSIVDNKFIGFLDFVGVLEKDKLEEIERNLNTKLRYLENGFADFSDVFKAGNSSQYPLSSILICPLRHIKDKVVEELKDRLNELGEKADELARTHASCTYTNISNFFASNDTEGVQNEALDGFFPESIIFRQAQTDNLASKSEANKASLLESARGDATYDIKKGDDIEEELEQQQIGILQRQGKLKNLTSIYDMKVFLTAKKAAWSVIAVIDILLLIYRSTKTYTIALKLVEGFEEVIEHDDEEFQNKQIPIRERTQNILRRSLDLLAKGFAKLISCCKSLQKRIMRTNLLPLCIVVATAAAVLYLSIVMVFNVMNVTVIEELGGFQLVSARLEANLKFTNLAIADQVDFIDHHELAFYKESMNYTMLEFNTMIADFNKEQEQRLREFNKDLCSLEEDQSTCQLEKAELLDFQLRPCIFPKMEAVQFDDYNGNAYRQQLKYESKKYIDAVRDITLNTIYFIVAVIATAIVIALLSAAVFICMKSRGMVRVKTVHLYSSLPQEVLEHFHLEDMENERDIREGARKETDKGTPQKVDIPQVFLVE